MSDKKTEEKLEEINKTEEKKPIEPVTLEKINELLTNNLKWSQIIYEQNRKINSKLLWITIAGWVKIVIIVVPIVLAIIFLAPMAKNLSSVYSDLLLNGSPTLKTTSDSWEQLLKLVPMNSAQQEQLKAILK